LVAFSSNGINAYAKEKQGDADMVGGFQKAKGTRRMEAIAS
jgi:hypothetical protein